MVLYHTWEKEKNSTVKKKKKKKTKEKDTHLDLHNKFLLEYF